MECGIPNKDPIPAVKVESVRPTWERRHPAGIIQDETLSRRCIVRNHFLSQLTILFILTITYPPTSRAQIPTIPNSIIVNEKILPWNNLKPSSEFNNTDGLKFFRLKTDNGSAACLAVLNLRDKRYIIKPFFNSTLHTTSDAARTNNALVAINGGYFNLSNGESTSYIMVNGREQYDPRTNKALIENPQLKPYLETILKRSEVTLTKYLTGPSAGEISVQFNNHAADDEKRPMPPSQKSSLQAGPRLLPTLTDKEEAFIRVDSDGKIVDAIGSHKPAARTAFGVTKDGHAMLLCVASKGQDEFSSGVTLAQLADILKRLGCSEAINFDGGTSTTMVIRQRKSKSSIAAYSYTQVCGKIKEKLVKSGLMILPDNE